MKKGQLPFAVFVIAALLLLGYSGAFRNLVNGVHGLSQGHTPSAASTTPGGRVAQPGGGLPIGPGPQPSYRVQAQPAADSCHYRYLDRASGKVLPDQTCTPGAINPKVTQANLASTICRSGYTSSIRPPASITAREKAANAKSYGYTGNLHTAEYDHLIALELGGDPDDARNLWVEPNSSNARASGNAKDGVETYLHNLVCEALRGKPHLLLATAQQLIATNWITAESEARQHLLTQQ